MLPPAWKLTAFVRRVGEYDKRERNLVRWHQVRLEEPEDVLGMIAWHRRELEALGPDISVENRVAWHRHELEMLDPQYRAQVIYFKLAVAEDDARARGLRPGDPEFPTIFDFDPIESLG